MHRPAGTEQDRFGGRPAVRGARGVVIRRLASRLGSKGAGSRGAAFPFELTDMTMLDRLLPRTIDNTYRGHKLALWLFGFLAFMRVVMSVNSIFNGYAVMTSADGIPLDTYPAAATRLIVTLWALLGLSVFFIYVLCVFVLVRYRSAIPFMFALLLLQHLGGRLILQLMPIVRTGTPPASVINLVLLALIIIGLGLSLWRRR
jgi:hypothetical protein